jgi:hypothetical protein
MAKLVITPAEVKLGAGKHTIISGRKVGVAAPAGKVVYFDDVTKRWLLGNSTTLAAAKVQGMVLASADPEQPVAVCTKGKVIVGATAAIRVGGTYVVEADGDMVEPDDVLNAVGKFQTVFGIGLANDDIEINPTISDTALV